jgi:Zn ribbon nucleic-acid-binding protein
MNMEATRGVTLFRGKAGINLGYVGSWIYWCVELLVVAGMATVGLVAGAAVPFCPACNTWKEDQRLGTLQKRGIDVAAFLRSGEIAKLKELSPAKAGGDLVLSAAVCPNCKGQSTIVLKLVEVTKNAKGEEERKEQLQLTYPGDSLAELEALFQNAPESSVPKRKSISFEGLGDLQT